MCTISGMQAADFAGHSYEEICSPQDPIFGLSGRSQSCNGRNHHCEARWNLVGHQQKTFPSGRNGSVRVDALCQSSQRHPGGGWLRARRQYHASCCTSPSGRGFAVSSSDSARAFSYAPERTCSYGGAFRTLRDFTIRIVKFWSSWDRCAALRETWCHILKAVVLRVP